MFIKLNKSPYTNKHSVLLVEGYRKNNKVMHRVIKKYGLLEDLIVSEPNILERLKKEAKELTSGSKVSIEIDLLKLGDYNKIPLNVGYKFIEDIYKELKIDEFINEYQDSKKSTYNLDDILRLLIYSRILTPCSKLNTYNDRLSYFYDFSAIKLESIYKPLDDLYGIKDNLCIHLNKELIKLNKRDVSLVFYDVTNYYFESQRVSDLRGKGVSKENRDTPIVSMGLFIDNNGLPITYELFNGSTNDLSTMKPILDKVTKDYNLGNITIVADKGNNSGNNLEYIDSINSKYVISQRIRNRGHKLVDIVLDQEGYISNHDNTFKYKLVENTRYIETKEIKEHIIVFWSKEEESYQKHKRGDIGEIITKFINNPSLLNASNSFGIKKYFSRNIVDKTTNNHIKNSKLIYNFNEDKYNRDISLDGYYCIVTNDLTLSPLEVIKTYHGLSKIEESFKITKTDLEGRPIYVWADSHIKGHFLICYLSLLICRLLQIKLGNNYSVSKISNSLKEFKVSLLEQGYYQIQSFTPLIEELLLLDNLNLKTEYIKHENLVKELKK